MIAIDKAWELVNKIWLNTGVEEQVAIRCALIAVDEIIEALPCREEYGGEWKLIDNTEYWEEVKQELESIS